MSLFRVPRKPLRAGQGHTRRAQRLGEQPRREQDAVRPVRPQEALQVDLVRGGHEAWRGQEENDGRICAGRGQAPEGGGKCDGNAAGAGARAG